MKIILVLTLLLVTTTTSLAQTYFGDRCLGTWAGTMYIYQHGHLRDSVAVRLTVSKTDKPDSWSWKTEYLSEKMPVTKDYVLRLKDASKNLYVTDEGGGLELTDYLVGNKLYSVFETQGVMLTSSYELMGNELVFEVTSGKKESQTHPEVTTYSTSSVQRVRFRRE